VLGPAPANNPLPWSALRLLAFDLDGTLVDSRHDLAASLNATLQHLGRPTLPLEQVVLHVGHGAPALIAGALQASGARPDPQLHAAALGWFLEHYAAHQLDRTVPYPGVADALEHLAGRCRLVVLTNKPVAASRAILAGLGLADRFAAVYGGDSFPTRKPDPEGLLHALAPAQIPPRQALMVGDTWVDVATGKAAGTWTCGVSYGFGAERLNAAEVERRPPADRPDLLLDDLRQLVTDWK